MFDRKELYTKRKIQLSHLRQIDPDNYPPYLDELLEGGYLHLYDHLIQMRSFSDRAKCDEEIYKMPLSAIAKIIVETREAIIKKLKHSIPKNNSRPIVFLLGSTGAGKSTAFCYLAGEQMMALKSGEFDTKNTEKKYINHSNVTSHTFLPNITVLTNLILVDFCGFHDSRGLCIELGVELALKALLIKYPVNKILLIESVNNTEQRYAQIDKLKSLLKRLVENTQDIVLVLTKYSTNIDYLKIKVMEEEEKKALSQPSPEEIKLTGTIEALKNLISLQESSSAETYKKYDTMLESSQAQLAALRQNRIKTTPTSVPDDKKNGHLHHLKETEDKIMEYMGSKKLVRFAELENKDAANECLRVLADPATQSIRINSRLELDPFIIKLLTSRFTDDVIKKLNHRTDYAKNLKPIDSFKKAIKIISKKSLLAIIARKRISTFLHLPELNPDLVFEFDKQILENCFNHYVEAIISLGLTDILNLLKRMGRTEKVLELEKKLLNLEHYVRVQVRISPDTLEGESSPANLAKWIEYQKEHRRNDPVENIFQLPAWMSLFSYIPTAIPSTLHSLTKVYNSRENEITDEIIKKCLLEVDQVIAIVNHISQISFDSQIARSHNKKSPLGLFNNAFGANEAITSDNRPPEQLKTSKLTLKSG